MRKAVITLTYSEESLKGSRKKIEIRVKILPGSVKKLDFLDLFVPSR